MPLKMNFVVVVVAATRFFYHICSLEVAAAATVDVAGSCSKHFPCVYGIRNFQFIQIKNYSVFLLSKGKLIVVYSLIRHRPVSFDSCTLIR